MARRRFFGTSAPLAALNVALLGVLVVMLTRGHAGAQNAASRARGEYTMVSGATRAAGPAAVYIVDSSNQEIVVLRWDQSKQLMSVIGYRDLGADGRALPTR